MKKYAIWNNKGGVGKSFLTFALSTEYAMLHPDERVVVIDLCPQANVSEILLGGNGDGAKNTAQLIQEQLTIGGYFDKRIPKFHEKIGNESDYFVKVSDYNKKIPPNLHLIAGDPSLELQVQTINNLSVLDLPADAWVKVHGWVQDLIDAFCSKYAESKKIFFLDCNPSFASYTEQAIFAASNLIVPCTPDGSSSRAIRNVFHLIYGLNTSERYLKASFFSKMKENGRSLPIFDKVVFNKSTTYDRKPAKAFQAMREQIEDRVREVHSDPSNRSFFSSNDLSNSFFDMPDTHTVAVVATSKGIPLSQLEPLPKQYVLGNGEHTQINNTVLDRYKERLNIMVQTLEN